MVWPFIIRRVTGHSMMPVLPPNTLVLGWRWFQKLKVGTVIIFSHNNIEKIKRIASIDENGDLFVVGDNPDGSSDSRKFGTIKRSQVLAKVVAPRTKTVAANSPKDI